VEKKKRQWEAGEGDEEHECMAAGSQKGRQGKELNLFTGLLKGGKSSEKSRKREEGKKATLLRKKWAKQGEGEKETIE